MTKTVRITTFEPVDPAEPCLEFTNRAKVRTVKQKNLTDECWPVQVWGLSSCEGCDHRETKECTGKAIRKAFVNSLGKAVPIS